MFDRGPAYHGRGAAVSQDWEGGYALSHSFLKFQPWAYWEWFSTCVTKLLSRGQNEGAQRGIRPQARKIVFFARRKVLIDIERIADFTGKHFL